MCYLVNEPFEGPSHTVKNEQHVRKRTQTLFQRNKRLSASASLMAFQQKKGEESHFQLKATITTRGFTCRFSADSMWSEMAAFTYSLCTPTPPHTHTSIGAKYLLEIIKVEVWTPFYGNLPTESTIFPLRTAIVDIVGQAEFVLESLCVCLSW